MDKKVEESIKKMQDMVSSLLANDMEAQRKSHYKEVIEKMNLTPVMSESMQQVMLNAMFIQMSVYMIAYAEKYNSDVRPDFEKCEKVAQTEYLKYVKPYLKK